jgi:hypothetical protein
LHVVLSKSDHGINRRFFESTEVGTPRAYEDVTQGGSFTFSGRFHMAEQQPNDELSVDELEGVAGGAADTNSGCTINTNCNTICSSSDDSDT